MLIIDNYDSFTFNLVQFFGDLNAQCEVLRNDAKSAAEILSAAPPAIILSPGPCTPDQAGVCLELVRTAPPDLPILGVCLGHQAIVQACGGRVAAAPEIMHGKVSEITHNGAGVFADCASPLRVTRYHSLAVRDVPDELEIVATCRSGEGDVVMAVAHKTRPVFGVQFHPESIACESGHKILQNFLDLAGIK